MWELQAATLRYSMEVIFRQVNTDIADIFGWRKKTRTSDRPSLHSVGLMLAGMTLECLSKAVRYGDPNIILDKAQEKGFREHNLLVMLTAVGYSTSPEEIGLVNRLSQHIRWQGRYPVPKKAMDMVAEDGEGTLVMVGFSRIPLDLTMVRKIADCLETLLPPGKRILTGMRLPRGRMID